MTDIPFDLADPPADPPAAVRQLQLWRVAICVFRDHIPAPGDRGMIPRCRACGETWPCRCRRVAERALVDSCAAPGAPAASSKSEGSEGRLAPGIPGEQS